MPEEVPDCLAEPQSWALSFGRPVALPVRSVASPSPVRCAAGESAASRLASARDPVPRHHGHTRGQASPARSGIRGGKFSATSTNCLPPWARQLANRISTPVANPGVPAGPVVGAVGWNPGPLRDSAPRIWIGCDSSRLRCLNTAAMFSPACLDPVKYNAIFRLSVVDTIPLVSTAEAPVPEVCAKLAAALRGAHGDTPSIVVSSPPRSEFSFSLEESAGMSSGENAVTRS